MLPDRRKMLTMQPQQRDSQPAPVTRERKGSSGRTSSKGRSLAQRYVSIVDYEFTPKTIRVHTGFKVTWVKDTGSPGDEHLIRFIGEEAKNETAFSMGGSFTRIFTQPGIYSYYCERHVFMRGEVIVEGSAGSTGVEAKTQSPKGLEKKNPASSEADAKYKEYVKKRQQTRDKITQARSRREGSSESSSLRNSDVEIPNRASSASETKSDSPRSDRNNNEQLKSMASLVRFGSFDGESDESGDEVREMDDSHRDIFSPRFGSFDELDESEDHLKSEQKHADIADEHLGVNSTHDIHLTDQAASNVIAECGPFDAEAAREFLSSRWKADASDDLIVWL